VLVTRLPGADNNGTERSTSRYAHANRRSGQPGWGAIFCPDAIRTLYAREEEARWQAIQQNPAGQ